MSKDTDTIEVNISAELLTLENRKAALNRLLKITQAIYNLQQSLKAVLILGESENKIPQAAYKFVSELGKKTQSMSAKSILSSINQIEKNIEQQLKLIMTIAKSSDQDQLEKHFEQPDASQAMPTSNIDETVNNFRRQAQTSVALRILLQEKGHPVPLFKMTVPKDLILSQIQSLDTQEQQYRTKIKTEIKSLQDEAQLIANNDELPEHVRQAAAAVVDLMRKDLDHLRAGKNINDIPELPEVVEIKDINISDSLAEGDENGQDQAIHSENTPHLAKPGFIRRLIIWASTPPSVSWKDINERYK